MMKPDIIISWPKSADYPLWRSMIHHNRQLFNEVIISFTETNQGFDYRNFVYTQMLPDYVQFVDIRPADGNDDWRNQSTNAALLHSYNAEWVWFTEQDFFPKEGFWEEVEKMASSGIQAIGVKDGVRLHPCCLFLKREALLRIRKNFGIVKDTLDHFGLIQRELEREQIETGIIQPELYSHLAGLTQNMRLVEDGVQPNHNPTEFTQYLKECFECGVEIQGGFRTLFASYLNSAGIAV